eukprot:scaffold5059_cov120-Isochrysis_galbana.AAC.2
MTSSGLASRCGTRNAVPMQAGNASWAAPAVPVCCPITGPAAFSPCPPAGRATSFPMPGLVPPEASRMRHSSNHRSRHSTPVRPGRWVHTTRQTLRPGLAALTLPCGSSIPMSLRSRASPPANPAHGITSSSGASRSRSEKGLPLLPTGGAMTGSSGVGGGVSMMARCHSPRSCGRVSSRQYDECPPS